MRHVASGLVSEQAFEGGRDLLGRPPPVQGREGHAPGDALRVEPGNRLGRVTAVRVQGSCQATGGYRATFRD